MTLSSSIHPLDRHTEWKRLQFIVDLNVFQQSHERQSVIPRHVWTDLGDVVASQRRHRYASDVIEANLRRKFPVIAFDLSIDILGVIDEIDLVDREYNVADSEQGN